MTISVSTRVILNPSDEGRCENYLDEKDSFSPRYDTLKRCCEINFDTTNGEQERCNNKARDKCCELENDAWCWDLVSGYCTNMEGFNDDDNNALIPFSYDSLEECCDEADHFNWFYNQDSKFLGVKDFYGPGEFYGAAKCPVNDVCYPSEQTPEPTPSPTTCDARIWYFDPNTGLCTNRDAEGDLAKD